MNGTQPSVSRLWLFTGAGRRRCQPGAPVAEVECMSGCMAYMCIHPLRLSAGAVPCRATTHVMFQPCPGMQEFDIPACMTPALCNGHRPCDIPLGQSFMWPMLLRPHRNAALGHSSLHPCTSSVPARHTVLTRAAPSVRRPCEQTCHPQPLITSRQRTMRSGLATVWCAAGPTARRGGHSRLCALCQAYQCALWQHADLSPLHGALPSV